MSLQGVLADFGVADVFQLIAHQRKTGVLEIVHEDRSVHVFFADGQVVRARPAEARPDATLGEYLLRTGSISETDLAETWRIQSETLAPIAHVLVEQGNLQKGDLERVSALVSDEAIFELFRWDDGSFVFRPGPVEPELGDRLVGAETVLLDALRMRDEWAAVCAALPDLSVVLRRAVDIDDFRRARDEVERTVGMRAEDLERLFTLVNGRLTARRAIDLSRLGTFQGARGLAGLIRLGRIAICESRADPDRSPAGPSRRVRRGIAPWLLAGVAAVALAIPWVPTPAPSTFPVPWHRLATVGGGGGMDGVEAALEAHRIRTGSYPEALSALGDAGDAILAGLPLDQYIYARTAGGYALQRVP